MFSAATAFASPIPKHGTLRVTAGERFNEADFITAQGRILRDKETDENVLDLRDQRQAMACSILLNINGGYLRVGEKLLTRVTFAGREIGPQCAVLCNMTVDRKARKIDREKEFHRDIVIRVNFIPATGSRPEMAALTEQQAERAGLTKADLASNGGLYTII